MFHRRTFIAGSLAAGAVLATGACAASHVDIPGLLTRHKVAAVSFAAIEDGQDGAFIGYNDYPEIAAAGLWTTPPDLCRALLAIAAAHNGDAATPAIALAMS